MTQKIDINKKYRTREGRPVRVYTIDGLEKDRPVVAEFANGNSVTTSTWRIDGVWTSDGTVGDTWDLVEVKPRIKRTVWLNVYADHESVYAYNTKAEADRYANALDRKSCVKVEIDCEEGEGL
jgi:hypothetical protein